MNRRLSVTIATGIVALCTLAACGGGGGSSPTPIATPTATPIATPTAVATAASGFVPATAAITVLGGASGAFGSTVTSATNTAVFAAQSAATPDSVTGTAGATLPTSSLAITESGGQATQSRSRAIASSPRIIRDADTMRRPDLMSVDRMRTIAQSLRQTAMVGRSTQSTREIAATPQNFAPGASFTFQLQCNNISGTTSTTCKNGIVAAPAHLITQTAHANIWLDDSDATAVEYPSGVQNDMNQIGRLFEQNYTVETAAYGPAYTNATVQFKECDANTNKLSGLTDPGTDTTGQTDPQINIIITNALAGTGEGGYFYGADMLSQSEANCIPGTPKITVNNLKMIVLSSDVNPVSPGFAANNEAFYLQETAPQTMAHEYQHYLHYINKFLQQIVADPQNPNAGTIDNSFVDEGCSVLAQDLVVAANGRDPKEAEAPLFVRSYLLEPDLFSLTSFSGYQPDPASSSATAPYGYYHNNAGNYGFSYLMMRYLYDRFGGSAALHAVYAEKSTGISGIDVGPVVAAAGGEPFTQVYQEFAAALAVHIGGGATEVVTDPRYAFSSFLVLRGPVQTFSRRIKTNIRNIVQPGPLNPEVFNGSQPALDGGGNPIHQSLTPGQTLTLKLISGATVFVTPTNTPATGATLRASDVTPNFQGSVGQGPIPTPAPDYY